MCHFLAIRPIWNAVQLKFSGANVVHYVNRKIRKILNFSFLRIVLGDPFGARTQDPNIKSVVLYRLS